MTEQPIEPQTHNSNTSIEKSSASKSNKLSLYQILRLPSPSRPRSQSSPAETSTQPDKKHTRRHTQPSSSFKSQSAYTMAPTWPKSPSSPRSFNSGNEPFSPSSPKSNNDYKRYNGTLNHYGRHANSWLFNDFSIREAVREGLERLRSNDK
ncbi:hypothetical protein VTN49DRAFT_769 [Thermomyces lanuginosus]|uniref:uncharacterized protein n=1 Tax=Thermomyces lanuginosus TaxID=5541 RepID=UPI0037443B5C